MARVRDLERRLSKFPSRWPPPAITETVFLARITGSTSFDTDRWYYTWTEVRLSSNTVTAVSGGRSGTQALNLAEVFHDNGYAFGVDKNGLNYPGGFVPQPLGGAGTTATHQYDVVVPMHEVYDTDGEVRYVFFAGSGSHDGECS